MDDIVKQALEKWPNVPHCYGWLALDARGNWRMRDERTQALNLPGDRIAHTALIQFINRNYTCDASGCWYFHNGPQRVYVDLELTPYILHTDPTRGFVLHTGMVIASSQDDIQSVYLSNTGRLFFVLSHGVAALDDRDTNTCLPSIRVNNIVASDEQLMAWMDGADTSRPPLFFQHGTSSWRMQYLHIDTIAKHFGFIQKPRNTSDTSKS